jgi:hypothetical protein
VSHSASTSTNDSSLFIYTLRVCLEKNYRLQDIQLSKNPSTLLLSRFRRARFTRSLVKFRCSHGFHVAVPPRWLAIRRSHATETGPTFAKATVGILRLHSRAKDGGEYRARTGDLLVANQALSQLS